MSKKIDWSTAENVWQAAPQIIPAWVFGSAQDGIVRAEGDCDLKLYPVGGFFVETLLQWPGLCF